MAGDRLTTVLSARRISKAFGGRQALDRACVSVRAGEVHGLVGENGSGKSTLIRVLAGYHAPERGGELQVRGAEVRLPVRPGEAGRLGLSFVHQDLALIRSLTVAENLSLGAVAGERGLRPSRRAERRLAREALARHGLAIDPRSPVWSLRPAERALLALARAVEELPAGGPGLLVLDEPTAFLSESEKRMLFGLVRDVAAAGSGVLLVSHDLTEVAQATDRITVLRDGRDVATLTTSEASPGRLLELMIGGAVSAADPREPTVAGERAVRAEEVSGRIARAVTLEIGRREVLGITGLDGSGFEELPYLLFGALPWASGRLTVEDRELDLGRLTPEGALRAGLALVAADRDERGSVPSLSMEDNLTLPSLGRYARRGVLARRRMRRDAATLLDDFDVRPPRPALPWGAFSGGNQQRAALAKWMHTRPRLLMLHEPARGVDAGARRNLAARIRAVARRGVPVVCASGDHEQVAELCDRALVLRAGRVVTSVAGAELTAVRLTGESHR